MRLTQKELLDALNKNADPYFLKAEYGVTGMDIIKALFYKEKQDKKLIMEAKSGK